MPAKICYGEILSKEVCRRFLEDKIGVRHLAKMYGITNFGILSILKSAGIPIKKGYRKYTLDETYFDEIDTEKKAYFLGLLYADGHNQEDKGKVKLALQTPDLHILEEFRKEIKSNRPIGVVKLSEQNQNHQDSHSVSICSRKMSQRLSQLGCFAKKSLTLKFPTEEQVPSHLLRHFLRGFHDGDGCFSTSMYESAGKTNKSYRVSFVSSKYFNDLFKIKIMELLGIYCCVYKKRNQLGINGRVQCYRYLDWLYENSTIYLIRKYNKYVEEKLPIENSYNKRYIKKLYGLETDAKINEEYMSPGKELLEAFQDYCYENDKDSLHSQPSFDAGVKWICYNKDRFDDLEDFVGYFKSLDKKKGGDM